MQKTPDSFCQGQHNTQKLLVEFRKNIFSSRKLEEKRKILRKTWRPIVEDLPCIAADILRMTKLEWSRLLHRCCHSVVMTISCQIRRSRRAIFGKIFFSATWNCTDRNDTTTEGEEWLNRSKKKKKTWWCRLYYYHCCKNFLSKNSSENSNSSSSSSRLELGSFWSAEW